MLISDEAELAPGWLRFVQIVVDASDLPLNVSREIIQQTPMLAAIKRAVTNRIVSELIKCSEQDAERFAGIWENFGPVLKEGLYEDPERRDNLFKLARFTTTSGANRSLHDYVVIAAAEPDGDLLSGRRQQRASGSKSAAGGISVEGD